MSEPTAARRSHEAPNSQLRQSSSTRRRAAVRRPVRLLRRAPALRPVPVLRLRVLWGTSGSGWLSISKASCRPPDLPAPVMRQVIRRSPRKRVRRSLCRQAECHALAVRLRWQSAVWRQPFGDISRRGRMVAPSHRSHPSLRRPRTCVPPHRRHHLSNTRSSWSTRLHLSHSTLRQLESA